MYNETIGIVGGFGAYATLGFYQRILEVFASDSERNYPHIIMDNNFTMPSRTRALLYGDDYELIVRDIADSLKKLCGLGVDHIILVCGTAHAFLADCYKLVPEAEEKVWNIIDITRARLKDHTKSVLVIAAEGCLKRKVYQENICSGGGVECTCPDEADYTELRYFIESVKRNALDDEVCERFIKFLERFNEHDVVLGCTEFPILARYVTEKMGCNSYRFWDPLELTIEELKKKCTFVEKGKELE